MSFIMEYMPVMTNVNSYFDARQGVSLDTWDNLIGDTNINLFNPITNIDGVEVVGSDTSYGIFSKPWIDGESRTWYFVFKNISKIYANWKTIIGNESEEFKCSTISMDAAGHLKFTRPDIIPNTSMGYTCQDWHVVAWVSNGELNTTSLWIDGTFINTVSNMQGWADDTYLCRGPSWYYTDNNTIFRNIVIADSAHTNEEVVENSLWLYDYYIKNYNNGVIYTEVIDFKDGWENQRPEVFTVSQGSTPFYTASTFKYNNRNTWRSGNIGHGGSTESTITFQLQRDGAIEFVYKVSSENNYDWLRCYLDGTQVVSCSGTWNWTVYNKNLPAGQHTLRIVYSKDGSANGGSDAGAIGQIRLIGAMAPYDRKYLLQDKDNNIYTIIEHELTLLEAAEFSKTLFQEYGLDSISNPSVLKELRDPKIVFWHDSTDELPKFKIDVTGVPPKPQVVISSTQDMSDSTILGIEGVTATCSDDVLFAISFDDEATWKAYDGERWITLDLNHTGMNKATMENIDLEAWREIQTSNYYKFRFILPSTESYLTSLVVDYIN